MKRTRDGAVPVITEAETRARAIATLKTLVCPAMYRVIRQHTTDDLLALIARVRRDALLDEPDADTG